MNIKGNYKIFFSLMKEWLTCIGIDRLISNKAIFKNHLNRQGTVNTFNVYCYASYYFDTNL